MKYNIVLCLFLIYTLNENNKNYVKALECGLSEGNDHEMVRKIANNCMRNRQSNSNRNSQNHNTNNYSSNDSNSNNNNDDNNDYYDSNTNNNDDANDYNNYDNSYNNNNTNTNTNNHRNTNNNRDNRNQNNNNNQRRQYSGNNRKKKYGDNEYDSDNFDNMKTTTSRYNKLRPRSKRQKESTNNYPYQLYNIPNQPNDMNNFGGYNLRQYNSNKYGMARQSFNDYTSYSYDNNKDRNKNTDNGNNQTDQCSIMSCILNQLHMTDKNGYPDRGLVTQALTRNVRNTELREFLQESTDDCFDLLNEDQKRNPCDYSKQLINCLAEKGRNNCDDWGDENLSF